MLLQCYALIPPMEPMHTTSSSHVLLLINLDKVHCRHCLDLGVQFIYVCTCTCMYRTTCGLVHFRQRNTEVMQQFLQSLKDRSPGTVVRVLMTDDGKFSTSKVIIKFNACTHIVLLQQITQGGMLQRVCTIVNYDTCCVIGMLIGILYQML